MKLPSWRLGLGLGLVLALMLALVLLLGLAGLLLELWQRLSDAPPALWLFYLLLLAALTWLGLRLSAHLRKSPPPPPTAPRQPPSEAQLQARLTEAREQGLAVAPVEAELAELGRRRQAGEIHLALFGEISAGKSSLVQALLPGARPETAPVGGTTRTVTHHRWTSPAGDQLVVADLPGLNEAGGTLGPVAEAEALRAHLVVYVCEGDLTREQYDALQDLKALDKPLILALNKLDRYRPEEQAALRARLAERVGEGITLVGVQTGGREEVTRIHPDGREETVLRDRPPRVEELIRAVQSVLDRDGAVLETLRDATVFTLAERQLTRVQQVQKREQADRVVEDYARKAVFGALAAVGPGTDVLIQGYLGLNMVKALARVYGVTLREVELKHFMDQAGRRARTHLTLLLALAGNVCKAFPGAGTVVGGLLHAVAYGLIFDSLGKAVARSLEARGELAPGPTLQRFEVELGEDLQARARRFARLATEGERPPGGEGNP